MSKWTSGNKWWLAAGLGLSMASCGLFGGGGGGSGSLSCPTSDWVPVDIAGTATAKEAWEAGQPIATDALGGDAKWLGGMTGITIGRDGRPKTGALVTGWAFTFCHDMDQVGFSVQPPKSGGQCAVNVVDCSKAPDFTPFAVDSPELIARAFPDDGADATYGLTLSLLNPDTPNWAIRNITTGETKQVDPQTGEVVTP